MSELIPAAEVEYHPLSYADPVARLFRWHGELFRAVAPESGSWIERVLQAPSFRKLVAEAKIVDTELTPYVLGESTIVLRHRELVPVTYPFEWCAPMVRDAALLMLDIDASLATDGLCLRDLHPWNVVFEGGSPSLVDIGSIGIRGATVGPKFPWIDVSRFILNPLVLMAAGHSDLARRLLMDYESGVPQVVAAAAAERRSRWNSAPSSLPRAVRAHVGEYPRVVERVLRGLQLGRLSSAAQARDQLREWLESLDFEPKRSEWTGYYDSEFPTLTDRDKWQVKHRVVDETLTAIRPATVTDVAGNRGWYSQLAASKGARAVCFDSDESSIRLLYRDIRGTNVSVAPVVMSLLQPSPALGLSESMFPSSVARFRGDLVLALAIVHHLVFKAHLTFEQIIAALARFTERALLVEFVPPDDPYVKAWDPQLKPWYRQEEFVRCLHKEFKDVQLKPSWPEPRVIFLCRR